MANSLGNEHSPYLRQHRDNPVHWQAWGPAALAQAAAENKLIIVSIGYSTCHWCHVMERESFENEDVAALMNAHFVSIKVDREERPDIDQIYMTAVQLMTGSGGWPLNCICLPDGRPIYGGTYFRRDEWMHLLAQLQQMWADQPDMAFEYAGKLAKGIQQSERLPVESLPESLSSAHLKAIVAPWKQKFDTTYGGLHGAPKFPMPNNWDFLLQYATLQNDREILEHVHFTLKKIASGGIYDHIGGGFARYSVDERWHVPHFEKMLYDNAQLVSLYLSAWQQNRDPLYARVVRETLDWVQREMTGTNGGFYCALDADSEGVEGKFYTFTAADFAHLRKMGSARPGEWNLSDEDLAFLWAHFNCSESGNWAEEQTNILYHDSDADEMAASQGFSSGEWENYLKELKGKLLRYRAGRIRPGLDDKQLTSWNALMLKAFCEAYRVLGDEKYLHIALNNARFIQEHLYDKDGGLLHQPADANRAIPGFLDDYACCIEAFIVLYETTFDEHWIYEAKRFTDHCLVHFFDPEQGIFFYTDDQTPAFITRKAELLDNVMPSSNSVLFRTMQKLGSIFDTPHYQDLVSGALSRLLPQIASYGTAFSNWAILLLHEIQGWNELIISGPELFQFRRMLDRQYIPNKIILGGTESEIPILRGRLSQKTQAYVCRNRTCSLPVKTVDELIILLKS